MAAISQKGIRMTITVLAFLFFLHHYEPQLRFYAPFPHGRRKMVGILSDQLQNGAINGVAVP